MNVSPSNFWFITTIKNQKPVCNRNGQIIPYQTAPALADTLAAHWISRHGAPLSLHSDQGRNFESQVLQNVCQQFNITKTRTTPLHPQSNGLVERFNRTILQHLAMFVNSHHDNWDDCVPLFLYSYRTAVHEVTGYTPAMILFGREIRMPCDLAFSRPPDRPSQPEPYINDLMTRLEQTHDFVKSRLSIGFQRMKARYDEHSTQEVFEPGDRVWLYNPLRKRGLSPKLQRNWQGPYTVVARLNDVVYRVRHKTRSRMFVVHRNRLARYEGSST